MSAESEIVAKLSADLERLEKQEAAKSPVPTYGADVEAPNETPLDPTMAKAQLCDFFDVPTWARTSPEVTGQIEGILTWASSEAKFISDDPTMADILRVINDQLRIMGKTLEPDKLRRLWQFTKIRQQRRLLDEKERGLYG